MVSEMRHKSLKEQFPSDLKVDITKLSQAGPSSYQILPQIVNHQRHIKRGPSSTKTVPLINKNYDQAVESETCLPEPTTNQLSESGKDYCSIHCPGRTQISQVDDYPDRDTDTMEYEDYLRERAEIKRRINLNKHRRSYLEKGLFFMSIFFVTNFASFLRNKDRLNEFCSLMLKSYQLFTVYYVFFSALYPLHQLYQNDEATLQDYVIANMIVTVQWAFLCTDLYFAVPNKFKAFFAIAMFHTCVIGSIFTMKEDDEKVNYLLTIMTHYLFFFTAEVIYHCFFGNEKFSITKRPKSYESIFDKKAPTIAYEYDEIYGHEKRTNIFTRAIWSLMRPLVRLLFRPLIAEPEEQPLIEISSETLKKLSEPLPLPIDDYDDIPDLVYPEADLTLPEMKSTESVVEQAKSFLIEDPFLPVEIPIEDYDIDWEMEEQSRLMEAVKAAQPVSEKVQTLDPMSAIRKYLPFLLQDESSFQKTECTVSQLDVVSGNPNDVAAPRETLNGDYNESCNIASQKMQSYKEDSITTVYQFPIKREDDDLFRQESVLSDPNHGPQLKYKRNLTGSAFSNENPVHIPEQEKADVFEEYILSDDSRTNSEGLQLVSAEHPILDAEQSLMQKSRLINKLVEVVECPTVLKAQLDHPNGTSTTTDGEILGRIANLEGISSSLNALPASEIIQKESKHFVDIIEPLQTMTSVAKLVESTLESADVPRSEHASPKLNKGSKLGIQENIPSVTGKLQRGASSVIDPTEADCSVAKLDTENVGSEVLVKVTNEKCQLSRDSSPSQQDQHKVITEGHVGGVLDLAALGSEASERVKYVCGVGTDLANSKFHVVKVQENAADAAAVSNSITTEDKDTEKNLGIIDSLENETFNGVNKVLPQTIEEQPSNIEQLQTDVKCNAITGKEGDSASSNQEATYEKMEEEIASERESETTSIGCKLDSDYTIASPLQLNPDQIEKDLDTASIHNLDVEKSEKELNKNEEFSHRSKHPHSDTGKLVEIMKQVFSRQKGTTGGHINLDKSAYSSGTRTSDYYSDPNFDLKIEDNGTEID